MTGCQIRVGDQQSQDNPFRSRASDSPEPEFYPRRAQRQGRLSRRSPVKILDPLLFGRGVLSPAIRGISFFLSVRN